MPPTVTGRSTATEDRRNVDTSVRLLVSVRDGAEALAAHAGGADFIDVKEPQRGPLGAASAAQIEEVLAAVGGRDVPITAALGELGEAELSDAARRCAVVKIGLAGQAGRAWVSALQTFRSELPERVALAPVAYADHTRAAAPEPEAVLDAARVVGSRWLVVDTHDKAGDDSLGLLGSQRLRRLIRSAAARGVSVVLAGGLRESSLPAAVALGPAVIGVRGAACEGGRVGSVQADRVRRIAELVRRPLVASAHPTAPAPSVTPPGGSYA